MLRDQYKIVLRDRHEMVLRGRCKMVLRDAATRSVRDGAARSVQMVEGLYVRSWEIGTNGTADDGSGSSNSEE